MPDSDQPVALRPGTRGHHKSNSLSDSEDLPDWVKEHQSPHQTAKADPKESEYSDDLTSEGVGEDHVIEEQQAGVIAADEAAKGENGTHGDAGPSSLQEATLHGKPKAPEQATELKEIAILMPDKVPRNKVLVELHAPAEGHPATDLAGDAGAVGRVVTVDTPDGELLQLDLKGVLYSATVLPLAGTAMVINVGPTEAKVETLVNDFVRLKEESSFFSTETMVEGDMYDLMADDDENYQLQQEMEGGAAAASEKPGKTGQKRPKAKASRATKASKGKSDSKKPRAKKAAGDKGSSAKKLGVKAGGVAKKPAAKGVKTPQAASKAAKTPKKKAKQASDDSESSGDDGDDSDVDYADSD